MKILLLLFLVTSVGAGAAGLPVVRANAEVIGTAQEPVAARAPDQKKEEDCGCEEELPSDVLGTVNGVKISVKDVDDPIRSQIDQFHRDVIESRQRELNLQVNSRLLETEARKRGISASDLLEKEVISAVPTPTEAEARDFYDKNRDRIEGDYVQVKERIIEYLVNQRQSEEAARFAQRLRAAATVKVNVEHVAAPATDAERDNVLATVNGEPVTSGDVEDALKVLVFQVQEQIYELRKQQLELRINDALLEQEAQKRKITTRALLDLEIPPRMKRATDEDAKAFYDQNRDRISGEFEQLKPQVLAYLQQQERQRAEGAFAGLLREKADVRINLLPPEPPVFDIPIDDQPFKGAADAKVVIVEFTDYECPSCARTAPILEQLVEEHRDRVKLVVRDYPLRQHANAFKAAEAAEAARAQGRYWEYASLLFANQSALGIDNLKEYATRIGLDRKRFDEAIDSGQFADSVKRDLQDGAKFGVNSTPTVFINGKRIRDRSEESLRSAIDAALRSSGDKGK